MADLRIYRDPDNYGEYDYYGDYYYNRIYNKMLDCDWFSAHLFDT